MAIRTFLADDHAVFRNGLRALLEKEPDFEVVGEAGNGPDTLKAIEEKQIDVLVLDIGMPGLSGTRVAEQALQRHPSLSIVILTMHEDEYYLQELLRMNVRGYVLKKSTGTEVAHAIRSVYQGGTYVDPSLAHLIISPYVGKPAAPETGRLGLLSSREQEVCKLLALGHTNAEVAEQLFLSDRTVETHRASIMGKLGLKTRAELVRFAIDNGLLKPE